MCLHIEHNISKSGPHILFILYAHFILMKIGKVVDNMDLDGLAVECEPKMTKKFWTFCVLLSLALILLLLLWNISS